MLQPTDQFRQLIETCIQSEASDLHISSGEKVFLRIDGQLEELDFSMPTAEEVKAMAYSIMHPRQREVFEEQLTLDLAYSPIAGKRFRVNVFYERGQVAMAIRRLDEVIRSFEELHLTEEIEKLSHLRDGLVLITGPTGSGKSTTLAALIQKINQTRACHIITIEDPVEYIHQNHKSLVRQRQLYSDVPSFADAVRASLREDPDVILVGEMRDTETMRAAITAAETGHLVFSTLHTGDAIGAIDRMIGVFAADEQASVRQQLSMSLKAVVAQRLLPRKDTSGRVPALEVLQVTTSIAHLVRTGRPQQIYSAMETAATQGMQTLEQSLADLVNNGLVDLEEARRLARSEQLLNARLNLTQTMRA